MPERPNGAVSKTAVSSNGHRGFKSHSLRHGQSHGLRAVPLWVEATIGLPEVRCGEA
jgi:hypothetical protein